jgi:hypothetical protein
MHPFRLYRDLLPGELLPAQQANGQPLGPDLFGLPPGGPDGRAQRGRPGPAPVYVPVTRKVSLNSETGTGPVTPERYAIEPDECPECGSPWNEQGGCTMCQIDGSQSA